MKRPILALFSAFFWFACSGSQPGPGAEADGLRTESQFCAEWATAACNEDVVSACSGTRSGCLQTQKSACLVLVPIGYQSENAEECIDTVKDAYEDAELSADELEVVLKLGGPCAALVDGGFAEGDTCLSSFDCDAVSGFACVVKPGEADGTCQIPDETATGGSCRTPASICGPADYCDPTSGRCISRLSEEPCPFDDACPADYRCEIVEGEATGTCTERLDNGDTCAGNDDCKSALCLGTTRKVCASNVVLTVESTLCDTLR
jgi:hypothetical protein